MLEDKIKFKDVIDELEEIKKQLYEESEEEEDLSEIKEEELEIIAKRKSAKPFEEILK